MNFSINHKIFNHITNSPNFIFKNEISFMSRRCDRFALGFIIPKSLGAASLRNLFRRRCRAVLQQFNTDNLLPSFGVVVKPKTININYHNINKSIGLWVDSVGESSS
jgi:ribonuclease P protein component